MALPEVDQSAPLGRIFGEALIRSAAKKIALLGSATGNGIEAVDFDKIDKLYALDINPDFLDILKTRFSLNISKIEAIACDLDRTIRSSRDRSRVRRAHLRICGHGGGDREGRPMAEARRCPRCRSSASLQGYPRDLALAVQKSRKTIFHYEAGRPRRFLSHGRRPGAGASRKESPQVEVRKRVL